MFPPQHHFPSQSNTSFFNQFPGRYPSLPCLPTVPGDEGVGEVVEIGNLVSRLTVKQRVIMSTRQLGTWRYYGIFHERDVHPISPNIPLADAAMLSISPCTAWKLLHDFKKLYNLQCVIQNAANSPVGQCIIQICKALDIHTFNIVASRCGYQNVKEYLKELGGNIVVTLEEAECFPCYPSSVSRPVLALNCLGGRFEDVMVRLLESGGALVNYGCAYDLPPQQNCYRPDISYHRFNLNEWDRCATPVQRDLLLKNIVELIVSNKLKPPIHETMELRHYIQALECTVPCEAYAVSNILFDFTV